MRVAMLKLSVLVVGLLLCLSARAALAETEDLGGGFLHHGVATPVSNHRGTVATVDGEGRNVVLVWLYDHRGGYALLMIDAETGESQEYPMPFPPGGDGPFASILSSGNRFYTHFNSHFAEFDPRTRSFTFFHKTAPQMAMGMTEDDDGVIWSVTYPRSGVVSFNPATREFKDYGHVHKENWAQYQRCVAADDAGWIYFGVGNTTCQIIAFDPQTGQAEPVIPQEERTRGAGYVYRDLDGKVYGYATGANDNWYELYRGQVKKIGKHQRIEKKPIITGSQGLFHRSFPDGKILRSCDLVARQLVVEDSKSGTTKTVQFDYESEGAHIMGLAAAPDNTICGGTAFPMRFFSYDPKTDQWTNRASYGQWNTVARQGDRFFVGGYGGGFLLEWDPSQTWVPTEKGNQASNPLFHIQCTPTIHRPHDLLAHPDGRTLVLAGTPGYGYTGGGLLFWDRQTGAQTLIEHTEILPQQSTMSLVALGGTGMMPVARGDRLLGGTTTSAGTGGEKKATEAELYIMDMTTKRLLWHEAVFPGVQQYTDMHPGPDGLVYGVADRSRFFVFDPAQRKVVHEEDTRAKFGLTNSQQGPRVFVSGPENTVYMLFVRGIASVDPATFGITMLAESPVPIGAGGDILNGRIYFASGSHVYSYAVPD